VGILKACPHRPSGRVRATNRRTDDHPVWAYRRPVPGARNLRTDREQRSTTRLARLAYHCGAVMRGVAARTPRRSEVIKARSRAASRTGRRWDRRPALARARVVGTSLMTSPFMAAMAII